MLIDINVLLALAWPNHQFHDSARPEPPFQAAIIEAVRAVTHIAPPDPDGKFIRLQKSAARGIEGTCGTSAPMRNGFCWSAFAA